ncbi:hypothetical protein [Nocardioides sp. TF02-7]|nr:hypothetical protein [Nocardioides sp. TF02-7]UMG91050.1 hypothetical protein MF408_12580 [Nocardioides sp. TF02-7]
MATARAAVVEAVARHDGDRARALTEAQVADDTRLLIEDHITMTRSTAS